MKKTYKTPTTLVVKIHTVKMIAASQLGVGGEYDGGTVLGRHGGSGWDDDDYDDYDE